MKIFNAKTAGHGLNKKMLIGCLAILGLLHSGAVSAQEEPLSIKSSFRVGSAGVICTAEYSVVDKRLDSMFDRAYNIVCRDAASPVGSILVSRGENLDGLLAKQVSSLSCRDPEQVAIENLGPVNVVECVDKDQQVDRKFYTVQEGRELFLVEGLKGYDSALQLAMASVVLDRPVAGNVSVATTSLSDPAAFARIRAGQLGAGAVRNQAYLLNNSGNFSEASEFFETLLEKEDDASLQTAEFLANQGLQQSNLGSFPAAESLFNRAEKVTASNDGVTQRLIRNFRALDQINQNQPVLALAILEKPVVPPADTLVDGEIQSGVIAEQLARQINRENNDLKLLGAVGNGLSELEKANILDGQALQIRGSAMRLQGRYDDAIPFLTSAEETLSSVRGGRVSSVAWLIMETQYELGLIAEAKGDLDTAAETFEETVKFAELTYPQSPALLTAKARLATYLARRGQVDQAIGLFDKIVEESDSIPSAAASMKDLLGPYFRILGERVSDDNVGAKLYRASQLLQRPGVAQTQAVFARELSEGNDEASALFRLTVSRTRAIARTNADIARLSSAPKLSPVGEKTLMEAREHLENLQKEQTALQSKLGDFAQYRVLSSSRIELDQLQNILKPGEAYYKVTQSGDQAFAQLITQNSLRSLQLSASVSDLDKLVADLRDSIVVFENGQATTYPFDVEKARQLYVILFGDLEGEFQSIDHMIFEPDGALLQLPPTLLIAEQKAVDEYLERIEEPDADAFDFTGIQWFGRERSVSIAVSQRAFVDNRNIDPSRAGKEYLGLGTNAVPEPLMIPASQNLSSAADNCDWPLSTWQNPIAADELHLAKNVLGVSRSEVLTGNDFSDTALLQRDDLNNYRIVHFATHGLVTAPKPQCLARPALLTSFGDGQSDGLLSFKEIFDLRLDADLVILSACDTAGLATVAASREAGITSGGNYALDGLVRAFVGAGARTVMASHWPVPDDFDATKTLVSGVFESGGVQSVGRALSETQEKMMDDPLTSHPYYWAAFVLVGDGAKTVIR